MRKLAFMGLAIAGAFALIMVISSAAMAGHATPLDLMTLATPAAAAMSIDLASLRSLHQDVVGRAAAKIAEIKDGMADEEVRRIETEHEALLRQANSLSASISAAEAEGPARSAEVRAERDRVTEIHRLALRYNMPTDFASTHIEKATSLDEVRRLVLEADETRAAGASVTSRVSIDGDEGDKVRASVEAAVTLRADPNSIRPDTEANRTLIDGARQWRGMSLMEMGRTFVEDTQGIKLRNVDRREMAAVLLGMKRAAGMQSTSDFPEILANVASKRLRDTYRATVQTWRPFCRQNNAPDFKQRAIVQLSGMPEFKKVREGGEYTYASLAESVERYSIATYGRIIAVTRQTLINDDLDAFGKIPALFGRAAAEFESDQVWGIIIGNPIMGDGVALFEDAAHGNISAAGGDPTETTVEAGDIAMGKQIDAAGKPLNLKPKFLAVSRKHKVKSMKLLAAVSPTETSGVNVYANSMDLIVEDRLYKSGAAGISPWLMIADPAQWDTIEYAYLEGEEGLYTEQRVGFEVDGLEIKGRLDFGAKAIDFKGFYKNIGN